MRKYILSAALISALSSSTLSAANLNGIEFFVGGSGFLAIDNAIKVASTTATATTPVAGAPVVTPIAGAPVVTPAASKGFLNGINANFGAKYLMEIGYGLYSGLDISFINPQNYFMEEPSMGYKYTAAEFKLSTDNKTYFMKDGKIDATNFGLPITGTVTATNTLIVELRKIIASPINDIDLGSIVTAADVEYESANATGSKKYFTDALNEINPDLVSLVYDKTTKKLTTSKITTAADMSATDAAGLAAKAAYDAVSKSVLQFVVSLDALDHIKSIDFKNSEVTRAVKATFVTVPVYFAASLNDSFTVYAGAKIGGGNLSIVEKATANNSVAVAAASSASPIPAINATHTATQNGMTFNAGAELGFKYVISDEFQTGLSVKGNIYGNLEKTTILSAHTAADPKTDLLKDNKVLGLKSTEVTKNDSLFGPADLSVSFNFTMNL